MPPLIQHLELRCAGCRTTYRPCQHDVCPECGNANVLEVLSGEEAAMHREKRRDQQRHARLRALERTGINLGPNGQAMVLEQIQAIPPTATFVERQSKRVSVWEVRLPDDSRARVVYDRRRKTIVTVLPRATR